MICPRCREWLEDDEEDNNNGLCDFCSMELLSEESDMWEFEQEGG